MAFRHISTALTGGFSQSALSLTIVLLLSMFEVSQVKNQGTHKQVFETCFNTLILQRIGSRACFACSVLWASAITECCWLAMFCVCPLRGSTKKSCTQNFEHKRTTDCPPVVLSRGFTAVSLPQFFSSSLEKIIRTELMWAKSYSASIITANIALFVDLRRLSKTFLRRWQ